MPTIQTLIIIGFAFVGLSVVFRLLELTRPRESLASRSLSC